MRSKGRKQRVAPLTTQTVALCALAQRTRGQPAEPLFPTSRGGPLSRDAVEWLIDKHATTAPPTARR